MSINFKATMKKIKILAIALLCSLSLFAQPSPYTSVDSYVNDLGSLADKNLATIADTITRSFDTKEKQARAIFYWIANNIAIDAKATKRNDQRNKEPEKTIAAREATPLAFSLLFQEMCSLVNIRCLSIDGYQKRFSEEINDPTDEPNSSWNVVQLGNSPDEWFYVDAANASGHLDEKMNTFTKNFISNYFFTDRDVFNLDHFADNKAWQLGKSSKNLKSFYSLPIIHPEAYKLSVKKLSPDDGFIKIKVKKPVMFSITYSGAPVKEVKMKIGVNRRQKITAPIDFNISAGTLSFSYTFEEPDEFPIEIIFDDASIVSYKVEVDD